MNDITGTIVLLESDEISRGQYSLLLPTEKGFIVVGTLAEALNVLMTEPIERVRANYITNNGPTDERILYARGVLRLATTRGVAAEIWTVNPAYDVTDAIRRFAPDLEGNISIYSKDTPPNVWFTQDEHALVQVRGLERQHSGPSLET